MGSPAAELKDFKQELMDEEELEASLTSKGYKIQPHTMKQIKRYNAWVEEERAERRIWRPKAPRVGRKEPFKNDSTHLATSMEQVENNPILKQLYEEGKDFN